MPDTLPASQQVASAPPLIHVDDVSKRFDGAHVLRDLTLTLAAGESLGLTGANGCGKSTLVNVITGFLRPEGGRVWLEGRNVTGWPPHRIVRAGIARTFQVPRLSSWMTVDENIQAAALHRHLPRRTREDLIGRIVEIAGLQALRARDVRTLSPGQMRRVELARALATGPRVLLLDEPFASLGPADIPEVVSALRRLRAEDMPMLIAAHSRALFQALCDRVALLQDGRIARTVRPGDLFNA